MPQATSTIVVDLQFAPLWDCESDIVDNTATIAVAVHVTVRNMLSASMSRNTPNLEHCISLLAASPSNKSRKAERIHIHMQRPGDGAAYRTEALFVSISPANVADNDAIEQYKPTNARTIRA
mmetsp:Transcript_15456/g.36944  ORF Transcript_15456/g.36944 Transcript_15456/m.36944 type:complete len:122 (-) Transcript_15456:216-581(-)